MIQEEKIVLVGAGLREKEAEIYLFLLQNPRTTSGGIMKKLNYYSKTVYGVLNSLIERGLASYVLQSRKKRFVAAHPHKLVTLLAHEKARIESSAKEVKELIPKLTERYAPRQEQLEAEIYEGYKGISTIFNDALKQKEPILVIGTGGTFKERFEFLYESWQKRRIKAKIPLRVLWNKRFKAKASQFHNIPYMKLRILQEAFENPAATMIYKNSVAIIVWAEKPVATLITNKEMARGYRNYFASLWKIAKDI